MTNTAILGSWKVVGMFAECSNSVVARGAVVYNAGMIKHTRGKRRGAMAARTIFCGGNMIHRFASGRCTIMAGSAVIHDTGMIEHRVEKTTGDVTDTAILRSG